MSLGEEREKPKGPGVGKRPGRRGKTPDQKKLGGGPPISDTNRGKTAQKGGGGRPPRSKIH